ncbi:hypothetical protein [Dyadobacter sp. CY326]|uniref:hypothetical protein n=1 Tax=Dyadobacter sp. CY326 TaxID=2907300 RepID=UPI001F4664B2|nr:hypothetical protein [Dyadobacter sp. CY326]MCE7067372.1 hypothetical protein [Dyadobacter sp. CY326]
MKFSHVFLLSICMISFFAGCEKKELDSPYITIISPTRNQAFQDKDSIQIKALIKPHNASLVNSQITVRDKKRNVIAAMNIGCACAGLQVINLERSFIYPVKKTEDVMVEICAKLNNGETICEQVPFVLIGE